MVLTLESEANNKRNDSPSPREFGNVGFTLDQTSTEFMRRGGWGVRSKTLLFVVIRSV